MALPGFSWSKRGERCGRFSGKSRAFACVDAAMDKHPRMKIGLLTPAWPGTHTPNGIATTVRYLADGLNDIGHAATILPMTIDARHNDPRVFAIGRANWGLRDKIRARFGDAEAAAQRMIARAIAEAASTAIAEQKIDVLIMEETQGWAADVADLLPIPLVVTLHGPWFLHKSLQSRAGEKADAAREAREARALGKAAAITAPSADVLKATLAQYPALDCPATVIPNPMRLGPSPHTKASPKNILFVGRFDRHKGGDIVIEAFSRVLKRHPDAQLTFVGPDRGIPRAGQPDLTLNTMINHMPEAARDRIKWLGQTDHAAVTALRAEHGMTLMASRYEVMGYTLLEALAAGSAIVSTDVGGPGEFLTHNETALLVPPDDPEAMAEAIGNLISAPETAERLGRSARALAEKRFASHKVAQELVNFLQDIVPKRT